jgi:hypothetical protein
MEQGKCGVFFINFNIARYSLYLAILKFIKNTCYSCLAPFFMFSYIKVYKEHTTVSLLHSLCLAILKFIKKHKEWSKATVTCVLYKL